MSTLTLLKNLLTKIDPCDQRYSFVSNEIENEKHRQLFASVPEYQLLIKCLNDPKYKSEYSFIMEEMMAWRSQEQIIPK